MDDTPRGDSIGNGDDEIFLKASVGCNCVCEYTGDALAMEYIGGAKWKDSNGVEVIVCWCCCCW